MNDMRQIIIILISVSFFSGCEAKIYDSYLVMPKVSQIMKSELTPRFLGTSYSSGKIAVGAPYELFVSIYPAIDGIDINQIKLVDAQGTEVLKNPPDLNLEKEKAHGKEGLFQYIKVSGLDLTKDFYTLEIFAEKDEEFFKLTFSISKKSEKNLETDWWRRSSSI